MGVYTEMIVGSEELQKVRGEPFLPGLIQHRSINQPDRWCVSQSAYGLAIVDLLLDADLEGVRELLQKVCWDGVPPQDFCDDPEYLAVMEEIRVLTNRQRSDRQERRIAKDTGGKRQPASGARWGARRDVLLPQFLIEAKTTIKTTYNVVLLDMEFLRKQAYGVTKVPVYLVEVAASEEVAVLPYHDIISAVPELADIKPQGCYGRKSISITADMARDAMRGEMFVFDTGIGRLVAVGYEKFLLLAKRGLDE